MKENKHDSMCYENVRFIYIDDRLCLPRPLIKLIFHACKQQQ